MYIRKSVIFIFIIFICKPTTTAEIKGSVETRDNSVDNYVTLVLLSFSRVMRTGYPALGIPVLDPLKIPYMEIKDFDFRHLKLSANASNVLVQHLSRYIPTYVHIDFHSLTMYLTLYLREIDINGTYWCDGMYNYVFPIFGDGPFSMEVYKTVNEGEGSIYITKGGYLQIGYLNMTIVFQELQIYLENFLGGGDFGDQVNEMISQLGKLYFDAMLPWIQDAVIPAMVTYINAALMQHTILEIIRGALPNPPLSEEIQLKK